MSDSQQKMPQAGNREEKRRFSVSTNRARARHRIRYVEAGGAAIDPGECAFCESTPDLGGPEVPAE